MKKAKISDLKNNLSKYLDLVRQGETIQVLDRDLPIATISSTSSSLTRDADEPRLQNMERKGLIRSGNERLLKKILDDPLPDGTSGVLQALLDEREDGM